VISIIIPCYNDAHNLPSLVKSIRTACSFPEIIVVDDGSQCPIPPSRDYKLVRQANQGPGIARNTGVTHATGNLVFFCDCDIQLAPGILDKLQNKLESTQGAVLAFGDFIWDRTKFVLGPYDYARLIVEPTISAMSLVKKEVLLPFRSMLYEDWDLWLRMLNPEKYHGRVAAYLPEIVFVTKGRRRSKNLPQVRGTTEGVVING